MNGLALSTDLYELTMMAGYVAAGMTEAATFEVSVRTLPANRAFLIATGLEQVIAYLESLRFSAADIAYLRSVPALERAPARFFDEYLPQFRFTGEVWGVPEGTPVFPREPLVRVTAPLPEAQMIETALLAFVSFQTSVASRAVRVVQAADGRAIIEFGTRRAHGLDAGLYAARAAYLAGCRATSNTEAGRRFGIPVSGTMAHSWITAFPNELDAFLGYAAVFGEQAVILLDTYDTITAARTVVSSGLKPRAVRLDSGDLTTLSKAVREILDAGGLRQTEIFASGDLDEWKIGDLLASGAPIDAFGVGAAVSTSHDAPALGAVYKLVEISRQGQFVPTTKLTPGKITYPGRKQVWRVIKDGRAVEDVIELADQPAPTDARPLLTRVMTAGRRVEPAPPLDALRDSCRQLVDELPVDCRALRDPAVYPVHVGPKLRDTLVRIIANGA